MIRRIIYLLFALLALISCSNGEVKSLPPVTIDGDNLVAVSTTTRNRLEKMRLPEDVPLVVRVDSECPPKLYLKSVDGEAGAVVIQVYTHDRLIKANMGYGVLNSMLNGKYGVNYFTIQHRYAEGGSMHSAILDMVTLACEILDNFDREATRVQRFFRGASVTDGLSDIITYMIDFVVPRDNWWGKVVSPFFELDLWFMKKGGSVRGGLFILIILFSAILLLLKVLHIVLSHKRVINMLRSGKLDKNDSTGINDALMMGPGCILASLSIFVNLFFIVSLFVYCIYLCKPLQENILLLQNIYSYTDLDFIAQIYSQYQFRPMSLALLITTSVVYLFVSVLLAMNKKDLLNSDLDEANKPVENAAGTIGASIAMFTVCAFIDTTLLYGLLGYLVVHMIINIVNNVSRVYKFVLDNYKKIFVTILLVGGAGFYLVTISGKVSLPQQDEYYRAITTLDSKVLNVRAEADGNSTIVGSIKPGEVFEVYDVVNGFAKIKYNTKSGFAYVSIKYIKEIE